LKTIPRYWEYNTYWLGYTDSATEGTWLNIYNGEELAIDKWGGGEPNDAGSGEDQIEMYQYGAFQWNDSNDSNYNYYRSTLCMKTENWEPEAIDLGKFLCETGLHQCHASATCVDYTGDDYQCTCSDITVEGIDLAPMSAIVSIDSECRYTLPEYVGSNVEVNIFTYDGKPTVYHYTDPKSYADSVRYCAGLGMHLPVPNFLYQIPNNNIKT